MGTPERRRSLRDHAVALAWSNSSVSDDVLIRKALVSRRFTVILAAAVDHGIPKVEAEWEALKREGTPEAVRATADVERIIKHMKMGEQIALEQSKRDLGEP